MFIAASKHTNCCDLFVEQLRKECFLFWLDTLAVLKANILLPRQSDGSIYWHWNGFLSYIIKLIKVEETIANHWIEQQLATMKTLI